MISFPVSPAKQAELTRLMRQFGIFEEDLEEKFIRGSGPGGQKINKTASCVWLKHHPSGMMVKCQRTRSQALNRYLARKLLVSEMRRRVEGKRSEEEQAAEKIRRQKRRRSRRSKAKMLENKKHRGEIKQQRKRPDEKGDC